MNNMIASITLGNTLLIGCIIFAAMAIFMFVLIYTSIKRENQLILENRDIDMIRYRDYHREEGIITMLDICRDIIARDAARFKQIGELFGDLPNMSPDQLAQEFTNMEGLKNVLLELAKSRQSESETLNNTITRNTEYINQNMISIEKKWPKETNCILNEYEILG